MFSIKGLSNNDLELLKKNLKRIETAKNTVIYEVNNEASALYFVETGSIKLVTRKSGDGRDDTLMSLTKPGGFFGEEALLNENSIYQYTAVAMENSVLFELSRDTFQKIMLESMSTGTKLLLGISKNYREAIIVQEQQAMIIAFVAPKDGVGNTTVAVNTAIALGKTGKKVAFLDLDFQLGNSNVFWNLPAVPNISRLIQLEEHLVFDRIKQYFHKFNNIDILLCPEFPQESEIVTRSNLNQIIWAVGRQYDYVVIDLQSHMTEETLLIMDMADRLVLTANPRMGCLTRMHRLFKTLKRLDYSKQKLICLLNRSSQDDPEFFEEYKKLMPGMIFKISENPKLAIESEISGRPWASENSACDMSRDLKEFVQHLSGNSAEENNRGGIFSRLKSFFS